MKKAVPSAITEIKAMQILDSRGIPTVEVDLYTKKGNASSISSLWCFYGNYEATELRDGDKGKYFGRGVSKAVKNINEKISEALIGMDPTLQSQVDEAMMDLDKTENKAELGANAILAVSFAACKAGAAEKEAPLYKYIADLSGKYDPVLSGPAITVISGGIHAGNNLARQAIVSEKYGLTGCNVGDVGGFAPNVSSFTEGLDLVKEAIDRAGYNGRSKLAMDVAATEFCIEIISSNGNRTPELYVECALYLDGVPFGLPTRTRLESSGPPYCWNELITLSTKYRDFTSQAQLAVTVNTKNPQVPSYTNLER